MTIRNAFHSLIGLLFVVSTLTAADIGDQIVLTSPAGLRWELPRGPEGWTLGVLSLNGKPVGDVGVDGILALRDVKTGKVQWLAASKGEKIDSHSARFSGSRKIAESTLTYSVEVSLRDDMPSATLTAEWSVDKNLDGYEVCTAFHGAGKHDWRCTLYPFAGNSVEVSLPRLTFCGVPSALLFRPDMSMVALFGIDPASDYLNPTTWTGATGFHFKSGATPAQFRVGGGKLTAGVNYVLPLQLFLSDAGESADAVNQLARNWIKANRYEVEPLHVRPIAEAFDLYVQGRRASKLWNPGKGYRINDGWNIIYVAESPVNAWFDYLLFEHTGDRMWRDRAFAIMDFTLKGQHTDPADPHYGVLETNYELDDNPSKWFWGVGRHEAPFVGPNDDPELRSRRFNSADHSPNFGFKLDMNGYAATYMMKLWERVKEKEGIDKKEWRAAAVRIADWIAKQQNSDGGLPQVVDYRKGAKPSISVVSGRTLVGMPMIAKITGDKRHAELADDLEKFLRTNVEGRYWFTGSHVDLYPGDFESDSVWHAVEYWLDKHERTKEPECLKRAEADAWFAFLMWCPKQLSWVKNPTQTCHAEQQHFLQYSNYCYNNRKYDCLDRLAKKTDNPMFAQLRDRIMQCYCWGQVTSGEWTGGQYERMSDPWGGVTKDINSKGFIYFCELALEANLQFLEMGLAKPRP